MHRFESPDLSALGCKQELFQWSKRIDFAKPLAIALLSFPGVLLAASTADGSHANVADQVIQAQQEALGKNTAAKGFGPQSPRDIDSLFGRNLVMFGNAPKSAEMNLCNISSVPTFFIGERAAEAQIQKTWQGPAL
jgi:hypothetical protein